MRDALARLERYHAEVATLILARQNPATGLIPASVAITAHGDYRDAWVRDNVYSILAVWGLALAYRRLDDDQGRAYELEHATIKCMRGLLASMIRQANKVELFKNTQELDHSLHAKYNTATGATVVGDREWGHLQIDATSIFLLMLAQMTASGLHIIYTLDEVHFVQNLVFYIERAYRTPDYGIWERGNKINHGQPELNCSSIGIAVAALQAINGINLFGSRGGPLSVIHVLPDEITRNYTTLHSALPRESASKEIDAALLAVISFPAFAVSDPALVERTRTEIIKKLGGKYGCKRFLRDGHQTVLEDSSRLHYEPHELKIFEGVESEWPLFFTYLILEGLFRGDMAQVEHYRDMLDPILVDSNKIPQYSREYHFEHQNAFDESRNRTISFSKTLPPDSMRLVPELYIVPFELIDAERARPGSQERVPNQNVPLVWAQSLYILGNLIYDGLLSVADIDPLNRRLMPYAQRNHLDTVVQLVILAETDELQSKLRMYGLETQTIANCEPITISPPSALRDAFQVLGENQKLKLSGRPKRPMGTLSTCKIYRCQGQLYAFLPHFMDREEFYLVSDNDYLVSLFEQELAFVKNHWFSNGRPTMVVLLTNQMLGGLADHPIASSSPQRLRLNVSNSKRNLLNFMMSLSSSGICNGVRVRVGRLSEMINTACIESLDFLVSSENAEYEDWEGVLRGREQAQVNRAASQLARSVFSTPEPLDSDSTPSRCTLRKFSVAPESPVPSKSPLTKPFFFDEADEREEFRLRDHREDEPSKLLDLAVSPDPKKARSVSPVRGSRTARVPMAPSVDRGLAPSGSAASLTAAGQESGTPAADAVAAQDSNVPSGAATAGQSLDNLSDSRPLLALTLGEPGQIEAAESLLRTSANLYDQVDLLHYLYSCRGLDYIVPGLCKLSILLEEVYVKAMHNKQWSVVRQTAGLLRKSVNSLTSNLSDLLVRQKPVTVGFGPQEFFIDSPKNPKALSDIIYSHCVSDVREAPLIQEVITYLGSFIRGSPQTFEGIMRIRTHFFVIAMREEISRLQGCDEEEAVELLMKLSPFEMKSLLGQVLTARDQVSPSTGLSAAPLSASMRSRRVHLDEEQGALKDDRAVMSANLPNFIQLRVQSGGFQAGNFAKIEMRRDGNDHLIPGIFGRGLNLIFVDPIDGSVIESAHFDTCSSTAESEEFARRIERLETGVIVAVAAMDDFVSSLTESAKAACEAIGSTKIRQALYRDSWCLIGEKGADRKTSVEFHRPAHLGPTEIIERTFDLLSHRTLLLSKAGGDAGAVATPSSSIMPSNGRWLRRRKNDGALNRVPKDFYPKVWKLLSKTQGIGVGKAFLPRDPIISEMTPEEFNFALRIETLFDNIRDPAERQVVVECVVVISRIEERNPEIQLNGGRIEILNIVRSAVNRFWNRWISDQGHESLVTPAAGGPPGPESLIVRSVVEPVGDKGHRAKPIDIDSIQEHGRRLTASTGSGAGAVPPSALHANLENLDTAPAAASAPGLSFEKNERLARRLFFDLPQDGPDGTMFYLATACVRSIFDVHWSA
nr:hypothetical protein HK105_005642 [Polyrhizophydium stewartii]